MAVYARYPIAKAPGMGENFFFVFSALPAATAAEFTNGWQVALGVVFVSGVLFLILSLVGLRELIFNSVSTSMKNGIAAGIGGFHCDYRIAVGWDHYQRPCPCFVEVFYVVRSTRTDRGGCTVDKLGSRLLRVPVPTRGKAPSLSELLDARKPVAVLKVCATNKQPRTPAPERTHSLGCA